jgi:hypothetical protein
MIDYKKCEEEFEKARTSVIFNIKCKKMARNTYLFKVGSRFVIRYHETDIVEVDENNNYHVRNGSWWTRSTLERINRYLPIRMWQNNSRWWYNTIEGTQEFTGSCAIHHDEIQEQ